MAQKTNENPTTKNCVHELSGTTQKQIIAGTIAAAVPAEIAGMNAFFANARIDNFAQRRTKIKRRQRFIEDIAIEAQITPSGGVLKNFSKTQQTGRVIQIIPPTTLW